MFEAHMSYLYFDWIIELESNKTDLYRGGEIMESLTRHGAHLSSTQILTLLTNMRKFIDKSLLEGKPILYNTTSIFRLTMQFANPAIHTSAPNQMQEPNPLNRHDGMQPNASGFQQFFSTSWKKQEFAMLILDILSSCEK